MIATGSNLAQPLPGFFFRIFCLDGSKLCIVGDEWAGLEPDMISDGFQMPRYLMGTASRPRAKF